MWTAEQGSGAVIGAGALVAGEMPRCGSSRGLRSGASNLGMHAYVPVPVWRPALRLVPFF